MIQIVKFVSWGFGRDSTYLVESLINQGITDFEVIASDPGQEMEYTYSKTIPFYKPRWEKLGIKVNIISRDYDIYSHFWDKNQVPLGWFNPYCSSHFKRDLIWNFYRRRFGKTNKKGNKYLAGRFINIVEMIGHSLEEKDRLKYPKLKWLKREYPNHTRGISKPMIKKYFKENDLVDPQKSACWLCPNKPWGYFRTLPKEKLDSLIMLEDNAKGTKGKPPPTLKEKGSMRDNVKNQTSLDDWEDLNCSEYCYT